MRRLPYYHIIITAQLTPRGKVVQGNSVDSICILISHAGPKLKLRAKEDMRIAAARIRSAVALLVLLSGPAVESQRRHPLDGLSAEEYRAVGDILASDGLVDADSRFHQISLGVPPKPLVKSLLRDADDDDDDGGGGGGPIPRAAVAYVRVSPGVTYRAEVDLSSRSVVSWEGVRRHRGASRRSCPRSSSGRGTPRRPTRGWSEGLGRRGLAPDDVYCVPFAAGGVRRPRRGRSPAPEGRMLRRPRPVLRTRARPGIAHVRR